MIGMSALHRRALFSAAGALFASSVYPIMHPTCASDCVQLDERDPLVLKTREIAAKTGVKQPHNIRVFVSEEGETGGSIGANLFGRGNICISESVYRGFHFESAMSEEEAALWANEDDDDMELPSKEEVEFILAHECVHLAKNHSLVMSSFVPIAMLSSASLSAKVHNKLLATLVGVGGLAIGSLYLSWCMEYEADHGAASLGSGFLKGGLSALERTRRRNCMIKRVWNSKWITEDGDYLGDTTHPWLTTRIDHLNHLHEDANCAFCSLLVTKF